MNKNLNTAQSRCSKHKHHGAGNSSRRKVPSPKGANLTASKQIHSKKHKDPNRTDVSKWFVEVKDMVNTGVNAPECPVFRQYLDLPEHYSKARYLDSWSDALERDLTSCGLGTGDGTPSKQIALLGRKALEAACAFVEAMHAWRDITRLALLSRSLSHLEK